jgi:hypothetical protein
MVTPGPAGRVGLASLAWAALACAVAASGCFERLLSDDAYYYFEIARNAALGQGPSFDSLAPTNGFHPLWAGLLVPLYALLPDSPWIPVRVALGVSALCIPVGAVGIQRLVAGLGAPRAGELAAYAWLLNPFCTVLAFRGMETPLAALLMLLSLALLVRSRRAGVWSPAECAWLGAALGACALARTDAVLWAAAVGACMAWDLARSGRAGWIPARGGVTTAAALGVVLPWLVWNLWTFGTPLQTSAEAKLLFPLYGRLPPLLPPDATGLAALAQLPQAAVRNLLLALLVGFRFATGEEWSEPRRSVLLFWLAVGWALALAGLALASRRRAPDDPTRRGLAEQLAAPLGIFLALHLAIYAWLLRFYASWYWLLPVLALCLMQSPALAGAERLTPRRYAAAAAGLAGALIAATALFSAPLFGRWPPERARALRELGARLPAGTRAGLWNAGELGYFFSFHFPDVRVLNLDGLVNNGLTRLARQGRYAQYLLDNVDVLLEEPRPYLEPILGAERTRRFLRRHVRGPRADGRWPVYEVVR